MESRGRCDLFPSFVISFAHSGNPAGGEPTTAQNSQQASKRPSVVPAACTVTSSLGGFELSPLSHVPNMSP